MEEAEVAELLQAMSWIGLTVRANRSGYLGQTHIRCSFGGYYRDPS